MWALIQIAINVVIGLVFWMLWAKLRRPPKDDPRLSRGLQLLQSKISVLEDLSDKTDNQVSQIVTILDKKCRDVRATVQEASEQIQRVEQSIQKSVDVAEIFEDRIPHEEIIERQRTKNYVKAAQLAHKGLSVEEIAQQVNLPQGELELIAKVNKDRLMFSEENLPSWAVEKASVVSDPMNSKNSPLDRVSFQMTNSEATAGLEIQSDLERIVRPVVAAPQSLEKLGQEFRKACEDVENLKDYELTEAEKAVQQFGSNAVGKIKEISHHAQEKIKGIKDDLSNLTEFDVLPHYNRVRRAEPAAAESEELVVESPALSKQEPKFELAQPSLETLTAAEFETKKEEVKNEVVRREAARKVTAPQVNKQDVETAVRVLVADSTGSSVKRPITTKKDVSQSAIQRIQFPRLDMIDDLGEL